ncbi:MAG TPA: hypothetical protein VI365_08730 [Trebonia sp.]
MTIEERVRAAAQAAARQVGEIRPLDLPDSQPLRRTPPPSPRWQGWLVPLAAAVTVLAIAAGLDITRPIQNGPAHPGATQPTSPAPAPVCGGSRLPGDSQAPPVPASVPQYFVEVCAKRQGLPPDVGGPGRLVVADIRTGAILGSVAVPSGGYVFSGVYGTAGDRAFVVSATRETPKGPVTALWLLRAVPGTASPVRFTRLPWTIADRPLAMAVSPDGTEVAVLLNTASPDYSGPRPVRLYALATGAVLRSWTNDGAADDLQWTGDGRALVIQYLHVTADVTASTGAVDNLVENSTFEVHDIATPGTGLADGSTRLISVTGARAVISGSPAQCITASDWAVSADGTTFICAAATGYVARPAAEAPVPFTSDGTAVTPSPTSCAAPAPARLAFLRFAAGSTQPGSAPAGTDYSTTDRCPHGPDGLSLWWASPDGTAVIGQLSYPGHNEVGVFSGGKYTPLPALGASPVPGTGQTPGSSSPWASSGMIAF